MKKQKSRFKLDNKDMRWILFVLIGIIIIISTHWMIADNSKIIDYFSFMSIGVSIILGLVAIWISLSQNYNTTILNSEMQEMLHNIDKTIYGMDSNINALANNTINRSETTEEKEKELKDNDKNENLNTDTNVSENIDKYFRYNGYIFSNIELNTGQLLYEIRENLRLYQIVIKDYSILSSVRVSANSLQYVTGFLIIVSGNANKEKLENACQAGLKIVQAGNYRLSLYFNELEINKSLKKSPNNMFTQGA